MRDSCLVDSVHRPTVARLWASGNELEYVTWNGRSVGLPKNRLHKMSRTWDPAVFFLKFLTDHKHWLRVVHHRSVYSFNAWWKAAANGNCSCTANETVRPRTPLPSQRHHVRALRKVSNVSVLNYYGEIDKQSSYGSVSRIRYSLSQYSYAGCAILLRAVRKVCCSVSRLPKVSHDDFWPPLVPGTF